MKSVRFSTLIVILFILFSCTNNPLHINHAVYKVKPGETIEIYTTTNSCCYYCLQDDHKLQHVQWKKKHMVEEAPEDCNGCSFTEGWIFEALQPGTDTIVLKKVTGGDPCSDPSAEIEKYIVVVDEQ